jgi:hypothetical protein
MKHVNNIDTKATFSLHGDTGSVQVRFGLGEGAVQRAQIRLGEDWVELQDTDPYLQMFRHLVEFQRHGVTTYVHMTALGPIGKITRTVDGREGRFWVDGHRGDAMTFREPTTDESLEMDAYRERIAALKCGDAIMWWEEDAQTGNYGWRTGTYHNRTQWGHRVQFEGALNVNGPARFVRYVMTMEDAHRQGLPQAQRAAA